VGTKTATTLINAKSSRCHEKSSIVIPRPEEDVLREIMKGDEASCVLVTGPYGSGKTTTVMAALCDREKTTGAFVPRPGTVCIKVDQDKSREELAVKVLRAAGIHVDGVCQDPLAVLKRMCEDTFDQHEVLPTIVLEIDSGMHFHKTVSAVQDFCVLLKHKAIVVVTIASSLDFWRWGHNLNHTYVWVGEMTGDVADALLVARGVDDAAIRKMITDRVGTIPMHLTCATGLSGYPGARSVQQNLDWTTAAISSSVSRFFNKSVDPETWILRVKIAKHLLKNEQPPGSRYHGAGLENEREAREASEHPCSLKSHRFLNDFHAVIAHDSRRKQWSFSSKISESITRQMFRDLGLRVGR
jgi:energy-coupling factor transporter ATP-binding protein EcfA2